MEYAYIRLLNAVIGLNSKVLLIKLDKEKFINNDLNDLKNILIKYDEIVTTNDIKIVFAINDYKYPFNYSGDQLISDCTSQQKVDTKTLFLDFFISYFQQVKFNLLSFQCATVDT